MRVAIMFVVSMFFVSIFNPNPAFATTGPEGLVNGEKAKEKADAGTEEDLAPLPLVKAKAKDESALPKPTPMAPVVKPELVDDDLAPLSPVKKKPETKKHPAAKKEPVEDPPLAELVPLTPLEPAKPAGKPGNSTGPAAKKDPVVAPVPSPTADVPKAEPKKDVPALVIRPERVFQAPPSEVVTAAPRSKALAITGYTVAGAGLLTVGLGAYFGIQAKSDYDKAKVSTKLDEFNALKQSSKGNVGNADLCYGIGGAAIALGIGAVILDSTVLNTPTKSVSIAISPNLGGASIVGTW